MQDLQGRVAVVTGAGSGIGRGIATVLAANGMNVVVADIDAASAEDAATALRAAGAEALAVQADVRKLDSVQTLADAAYERFGAVHVLCNNAGVMGWHHASEATHADWEFVLSVNLWGVIHGVEAFLPRFLAQGGEAHIVNTASIAGVIPSAVSAVYSTTKYAIVGLSETMANELRETGIGVSVLCPGAVTSNLATTTERERPDGARPRVEMPGRVGVASYVEALTPEAVGHMVADAIRTNRVHIFTEPTLRAKIEERFRGILADFDALDAHLAGRAR
ncbi:MAG: SDR family NAD(P)-dependent oxidoreductase [Dehalococcoidia bacterium]|nr:SDR family NAD(P)-dependent oxidoreductase [Dehalococcoidia bacterium]